MSGQDMVCFELGGATTLLASVSIALYDLASQLVPFGVATATLPGIFNQGGDRFVP